MTPRAPLALGAVAMAAAISLSAHASVTATTTSNLGATASFDRRSVEPGQIAVAEVTVQNQGPEVGGSAAISLTVNGGTTIRTRAAGGRCGRPRAGLSVRCTVRVSSFGRIAGIGLHIRAGMAAGAVRLSARVSSTGDPRPVDNRVTARIPVSARPGAQAELSYVFEAPAQAVVRRPFTARLRILNRGPGAALVTPIALTASPTARVVMPRLPLRLAAGAERTLDARVTPLRVGRLLLDLRVGRTGRSRLTVAVRGAAVPA